jgi:hypothetical protein
MKQIILSIAIILLITSCKKESILTTSLTNKVLMLKVDYLTNNFEGGKEFSYSNNSSTFTITKEYKAPGDFGNIKLIYQELNETIFDGSIIWMGTGKISIPQNILNANQFNFINKNDTIFPSAGFENVFNIGNQTYDYSLVWNSVQKLIKVRDYLNSNPNGQVKLFLYTPSVGVGNPADWDWIIYLKN